MSKTIKLFLFAFLVSLSTIIIKETLIENQYIQIKHFLFKKYNSLKIKRNNFVNCLPEVTDFIKKDSILVVGHAYGKFDKKNDSSNKKISSKLDKFLEKNKRNISTVIFTGDVFYTPSFSGWKSLYSKYEDYFKIYVAPGNHDVGSDFKNTKRDIFNIVTSGLQPNYFPFLIEERNFSLIIDDSSTKDYKRLKLLISEIKDINQKVYVLRHHSGIQEINNFTNSKRKKDLLFTKKELEDLALNSNKIIMIYGDGGNENKPSIACFSHGKIHHIVNGIGNRDDDKVLIIDKGKIYLYKL